MLDHYHLTSSLWEVDEQDEVTGERVEEVAQAVSSEPPEQAGG